MATDPALPGLMGVAEGEPLDDLQRANLREIRRAWRSANARCPRAWCRQDPGQRALRARLAQPAPGQ